ncbi:MAG: hypothetical protein A3G25_00210 [Betaproteobacteria bacterium RIFCSPLOWO2_12_FULL_63_13]|nr:MAG: hypothetical protein A3H32_18740 [Betaproteobacteria bacterium RIFCSPLOWO2_02_FULL_63_19]OGA51098.1 MAG: hypothetical protein A3G25_00210 [Betaproteobacteria bacterium RIFCSPLOWO2_12_FULL_63_13]
MELTQDDVIRILKLIDESPMGRVSLQVGDLKLEVDKGSGPGTGSAIARTPQVAAAPESKPAATVDIASGVRESAAESAQAEGNLIAIKAPLLGIFYRRSQPGAPPYVEEGSLVEEDTTVALIEVMKLFNPVRAGVKGRIHRICAENNTLVEYEQVLFLVKPE